MHKWLTHCSANLDEEPGEILLMSFFLSEELSNLLSHGCDQVFSILRACFPKRKLPPPAKKRQKMMVTFFTYMWQSISKKQLFLLQPIKAEKEYLYLIKFKDKLYSVSRFHLLV